MRDQLVDPQVQSTEGAGQAGADVDLHGLPPEIHARVMQVRPGEGGAEVLAKLLKDCPEMESQILEAASAYVGMSTVKQAMSIRENPQAGISLRNQAEIREITGADTSAAKPAEAPATAEASAATAVPAATSAAPATDESKAPAHKKAEPAWVEGARRYNAANPTLVEEFNELTGGIVALDDFTALDPKAVASWQRNHGIPGDGKVGPQTVATARAQRGSANAVAKADTGAKGELIDT